MPDLSLVLEVRPAFFEVDPMAVVWHGHYVKYFELARSALMARFGYDYQQMRDSGYRWPIVDLRIKFVRPAVLQELLLVRAEITEFESRLRVQYLVTQAATGAQLTKGHTIQVAVEARTGELQYVCPRVLWERLGVTPDR
jgi:acyl-CoA thioester hydrolase